MGKVPQVIAAWLITATAVAGCTGHVKTALGTVTGIFIMAGGPADSAHPSGVRRLLPGHVIAASIAGGRFTVSTGKSGRFTMPLPPGTYQLTGYSPQVHADRAEMRCTAVHAVHVQAGKATRGVEVVCSIP